MQETEAVTRHYGAPRLVERLLGRIGAEGVEAGRLSAADLRGHDQLHGGGIAATEGMAAMAGLAPGMRVLDAGSGLGGTSRFLAEQDCEVEAIDLTPEFVDAAEELNRLCGLGGRIRTQVGSVTALPYADGTFDLVWSHYVAMNVSDKADLWGEAFRVLRPGGRLVFAMLAEGPAGAPHFPLPWARDGSASFLSTPEAVEDGMRAAGFRIAESHRPQGARPPAMGDRGLGAKTAAMGDDMAEREGNAARSVAEGRLVPMVVLAERPA